MKLRLKCGQFECWETLKPKSVVPMEVQISAIRSGWYGNLPIEVRAKHPEVMETIEQEPNDPA